ncbi:hypothetical protein [Limosilactobacillus caviae]|uniref:hypothetical protein n=1 Tax=Limosilactobacillus caviae TaxID=1769424 RepID=UPI001E5C3D31|nr:hypothetical protein [Limosilactobacillus caviae]MCD7123343.1 hypothetical protein [Limosilactobacillus caviae]
MKKYFRILIAVFVGISVISISGSVHAMTTKDLSGRVYKVSTNFDDVNFEQYVYFDNKGHCVVVGDPSDPDNDDAKSDQRKINKLILNKKSAKKQFKGADKYKIEDNEFKTDASIFPMLPMLDNPIEIVSDNIDNITVRFLNNSPRARMLSDDGNGIYMTYSMTTADPSMQYRFQW